MKRLTYYIIGLAAMGFSSFAAYHTLKEVIPYQINDFYIIAGGLSCILSGATHIFSKSFIEAVSLFIENKKVGITADLMLFVLLACLAVCLDLKGVSAFSVEKNLTPIEAEENNKIDSKLKAIANQERITSNNAKHTKNGRTNWAMYGTYTKSIRELKVLRSELSELKKEKDQNIKKAMHTASAQQNKMMGGVIVSLLLTLLSNWGLSDYSVRTVSAQHAHTVKITSSDKEVNEELKAVNEYKERSLSQLEIDLIDGLSIRKSSAKHNLKDWEVRQVRKELIDSGYIS